MHEVRRWCTRLQGGATYRNQSLCKFYIWQLPRRTLNVSASHLKPCVVVQEGESCAERPSTNQAVRQPLATTLIGGVDSKRAHLIKSEFSVYGTFIAGRCPRYKAVSGSNSVNSDHHFMEMDGEVPAMGYESEM